MPVTIGLQSYYTTNVKHRGNHQSSCLQILSHTPVINHLNRATRQFSRMHFFFSCLTHRVGCNCCCRKLQCAMLHTVQDMLVVVAAAEEASVHHHVKENLLTMVYGSVGQPGQPGQPLPHSSMWKCGEPYHTTGL